MREGDVVGGRFVVEALGGTGGMGAVYRARDRVSDRLVALKVITEDGVASRFEQEARVLAELDHPAIVRYVAHGRTSDDRPYLAMEWLDGEDLRARLARGRLTIQESVELVRRVAEALAAAHARGVVHRDIKPGNLFLAAADPARITVLDFGIARTRTARAFDTTALPITRTGMVVGTVGYMSPEQARGASDVDARADVFALGCVLFECITGRPAFVGANAVAVLAKVLLEEAPRVRHFEPSVPVAVDELVARMLAKDAATRPRDAAAVLRALDASDAPRVSTSSGGVGDREQRMVTIVLARHLDFDAARECIDGEPIALADGAMLLEFRGNDPATRAAVCALAIARQQPRASLAIATGRVHTASAYGPLIDRVATMPSASGIPIDDVSATLLGDRFEISAGVLMGAARTGSRPRTLLGKNTPCVGRDKELALLEATFRECVNEPIARGLVVTGPAGSGKTRLAHELLTRVRDDATVLIARGDPVGAGSALGVVRQLVRNAAGLRDGDPHDVQYETLRLYLDRFFSGDALARSTEMLGELVGAPSDRPSPQLRAARDDARILASWLARSFADWIAALADSTPVLCVIEDLHWGDGASVGYLDEALRANAMRPLMILALSRPEVHDLFPELWARASAQEVRLPGLTRRAAERLVRSVLAGAADEDVARLVERADGNAFYLEELIRHVSERGVASLPDTILSLAESRIARLDPEARRFLRVASVFGESFWERGVASLLPPDANVEGVLPRLIVGEVVSASAPRKFEGEYVFRHSLLRDAAYAMLAEEDRAALHLKAAEWLESVGEKDALVLADHFERAGDRARAAPCFLRAAAAAMEAMNVSSALALADRGVRCGAEGELLGGLRVIQSVAAASQGDHQTAARYSKIAYRLLPERTSEWYLAAAMSLSSGAYVGDLEFAPAIVQMILTTAPEGRPQGSYGFAVRVVCDILDTVGQHDSVLRLLENADALAAEVPDPDFGFLAAIDYARCGVLLRRDTALGEVIASASRGMERSRALNDVMGITFFRMGQGMTSVECGEYARARIELRDAGKQLEEAGASLIATWCSIHIGWSYWFEGRFDDAIVAARRAFETFDRRHGHALAALAHLSKGELTEAERLSELALQGIDDEIVTPFVVSVARTVAARVALAAGRIDVAMALSERAYQTSIGTALPSMQSLMDRTRIEVLLARGEHEAARARIAEANARLDRHARSLDESARRAFLAMPDNARIRELSDASA